VMKIFISLLSVIITIIIIVSLLMRLNFRPEVEPIIDEDLMALLAKVKLEGRDLCYLVSMQMAEDPVLCDK
jgi:hypothetical protein